MHFNVFQLGLSIRHQYSLKDKNHGDMYFLLNLFIYIFTHLFPFCHCILDFSFGLSLFIYKNKIYFSYINVLFCYLTLICINVFMCVCMCIFLRILCNILLTMNMGSFTSLQFCYVCFLV